MKYVRTAMFASAASLLLSACGGSDVKETLGLERKAPDEFRVVSRPPLSVPPEFNLRPPGDTQNAAPSVAPVHKQAESLLLSDGEGNTYALPAPTSDTAVVPVSVSTPSSADSAEMQFLKNAGADNADSTVRTTLEEEKISHQIQKEEEGWWDSVFSGSEAKDPTVDAKKEAERIQKNQDEGKPVNDGEIADTKGKDRGMWGRIFGD